MSAAALITSHVLRTALRSGALTLSPLEVTPPYAFVPTELFAKQILRAKLPEHDLYPKTKLSAAAVTIGDTKYCAFERSCGVEAVQAAASRAQNIHTFMSAAYGTPTMVVFLDSRTSKLSIVCVLTPGVLASAAEITDPALKIPELAQRVHALRAYRIQIGCP